MPDKCTTPSYCILTARVIGPVFISVSNLGFEFADAAPRNVLFAENPVSIVLEVSSVVQ